MIQFFNFFQNMGTESFRLTFGALGWRLASTLLHRPWTDQVSCNAAAHGAPWRDAMQLWHWARKRHANNHGDFLKDDLMVIYCCGKCNEGSEQLRALPFE